MDTLLSVRFARSVKGGTVHAAAALAIADVLGYCDHPPDSVVYLEFINQIRTLQARAIGDRASCHARGIFDICQDSRSRTLGRLWAV